MRAAFGHKPEKGSYRMQAASLHPDLLLVLTTIIYKASSQMADEDVL
jgi:hypothetical protein